MKGLLQSKHFKKNLQKWVFMYAICMVFFTTVVTYSKYISNMLNSGDSARVSKFDLDLIYCSDENCTNNENKVNTYLPFGDTTYYYAVDSSNLEVNLDIYFTITADKHFKIKEVDKITDKTEKLESITKNSDGKTVSVKDTIKAGSKQLAKYKVIVTYDESVVDYNRSGCTTVSKDCQIVRGVTTDAEGNKIYKFNDIKEYDTLKIGYSATQKR